MPGHRFLQADAQQWRGQSQKPSVGGSRPLDTKLPNHRLARESQAMGAPGVKSVIYGDNSDSAHVSHQAKRWALRGDSPSFLL